MVYIWLIIIGRFNWYCRWYEYGWVYNNSGYKIIKYWLMFSDKDGVVQSIYSLLA